MLESLSLYEGERQGKLFKFNFCLANKANDVIGFRAFNACFVAVITNRFWNDSEVQNANAGAFK